jgi:hypothetical protein
MYNAPTASEVAVIFQGNDDELDRIKKRDLVIRPRGSDIKKIPSMNKHYDSLLYVLLLPFGELGWSKTLKHSNGTRNLTLREFSAHRLMYRAHNTECNHYDENSAFNIHSTSGKITSTVCRRFVFENGTTRTSMD